jgi:hypothetical protein
VSNKYSFSLPWWMLMLFLLPLDRMTVILFYTCIIVTWMNLDKLKMLPHDLRHTSTTKKVI